MRSGMPSSVPTHDLLEPPRAPVRPYPHHSPNLALQKYLLLQEQHEYLRQHLDELRPRRRPSLCTPVTPSSAAPPAHALACSSDTPARRPYSFSFPPMKASYGLAGGAAGEAFGGGMPRPDTALAELAAELAAEEAKLFDVNEGIKRALTELLNCETVRTDHAFRTWVQSRLMDTERELRSGRRRRSAPSLD